MTLRAMTFGILSFAAAPYTDLLRRIQDAEAMGFASA